VSAEVERLGGSTQQPEPRRHHFVPACWLAGFTESGDKDGQIWVTDFRRGKQWPSSPGNAGFIRDFYRLSDEELDPALVEKGLSQIEGVIAPILRGIDKEVREPYADELDALLYFIAIQWARVPAFRPAMLKLFESFASEEFNRMLETKESWEKALTEAGIPLDAPGAEYEGQKASKPSDYTLNVSTDWYVQRAFEAADNILPSLRKRVWQAAFSPTGSFVACDNPVMMEGPKGQPIGFGNASIVLYAISRHVLLYGTLQRVPPLFITRKYIAHTNTFSLLRAEEQVFSHVPDFCWLDEHHKYQTDWTLFSKEKY
jgi:hypothetical protein